MQLSGGQIVFQQKEIEQLDIMEPLFKKLKSSIEPHISQILIQSKKRT